MKYFQRMTNELKGIGIHITELFRMCKMLTCIKNLILHGSKNVRVLRNESVEEA